MKKYVFLLIAVITVLCFAACGNSGKGEEKTETVDIKQEENVAVEDKSEELSNEEDAEKNIAVDDAKEENVVQPEDSNADENAQMKNEAENAREEAIPSQQQTVESNSGSAERRVADVVELLNGVVTGAMPEDASGMGTASFRADGTKVVIVISVSQYSAAQILERKDMVEQYCDEMVSSYGLVSAIKEAESSVSAVGLEVYGNGGDFAFSKLYN